MVEKLEFMKSVVVQAGDLALLYFSRRAELKVEYKARKEIFSEADIKVEKLITDKIKQKYPSDQVMGEESDRRAFRDQSHPIKGGLWIIDPIDGTTNFLIGMRFWCVVVSYVEDGELLYGCIYNPVRNELFWGKKGGGAWKNGMKMSILQKDETSTDKMVLGIGLGRRFSPDFQASVIKSSFENKVDLRQMSCCALMLAQMASNVFSAYFEPHINSWDCLAGILIAVEAGAEVNDFLNEKGRNGLIDGNRLLVARPHLYDWFDGWLPRLDLENWVSLRS